MAVASGMAATVNPCGFALLPAYLAAFVGDEHQPGLRAIPRAFKVSAALTAGFVAVFGAFGLIISPLALSIEKYLPWATIVIGLAVIGLGVALLAGRQLTVHIPKLERGGRDGTVASMFVFGVSYAVASLSCTIGPFLAVTSSTFRSSNFVSGVAVFVVYAPRHGCRHHRPHRRRGPGPAPGWSASCAGRSPTSRGSRVGSWSWPAPTWPGTAGSRCAPSTGATARTRSSTGPPTSRRGSSAPSSPTTPAAALVIIAAVLFAVGVGLWAWRRRTDSRAPSVANSSHVVDPAATAHVAPPVSAAPSGGLVAPGGSVTSADVDAPVGPVAPGSSVAPVDRVEAEGNAGTGAEAGTGNEVGVDARARRRLRPAGAMTHPPPLPPQAAPARAIGHLA